MSSNVFPTTAPAYFPVALRDVVVPGAAADAFQAVVREDTNQVLGVHRRGYKLVPNREIFTRFEEVLLHSGVPLDGLSVRDQLAQGGRMVVRNYLFPKITAQPQLGDIVRFALTVTNSYDGGAAFRAFMSGLRLVCTNGMVMPSDKSGIVYARHTAGFSAGRATAKITAAVDAFLHTWSKRWTRWAEREITTEQAGAVFNAMPGINPRRLAALEEAWGIESAQAGASVWGLYNAMTRWATHAEVRASSSGNRAAIVLGREAQVERLLQSPEFTQLES